MSGAVILSAAVSYSTGAEFAVFPSEAVSALYQQAFRDAQEKHRRHHLLSCGHLGVVETVSHVGLGQTPWLNPSTAPNEFCDSRQVIQLP